MGLNKDKLMFEKVGKYEYVELNKELIIRYSLGDERFAEHIIRSIDKRKLILFCTIWTFLTLGPACYCFLNQKSVSATAIFLLLGFAGLFIAFPLLFARDVDLTHKKYYSVIINKKGISEVWDFPEGKFEKTLLWKDVKYSGLVLTTVSMVTELRNVEFIVYSSEGTNEVYFRPIIKKAWDLDQYDLKLKDLEHTIFIYAPGLEMSKLIDNFLIRNKIELPEMKE